MQQLLFRIPDPTGFFPDGIPLYGYGVMLFITFLVCTWFARRHAARAGMTSEQLADLALWLFFWGIVGGRVVFMIQYRVPATKFFNLWEGGLVVYGALIGGFIAYWVFYYLFLKKFHVSSWRLGDVAAPTIAIGIALGRIGCLLNGCCYGGVAGEGCPDLHFPLLTAPVREAVVENRHYQTVVGFSTKDGDLRDSRTVVDRVEPGSAAEQAGLKPGDRIVAFNGKRNDLELYAAGPAHAVDAVAAEARSHGYTVEPALAAESHLAVRVFVPDAGAFEAFEKRAHDLAPTAAFRAADLFNATVMHWPRGVASLALTVVRGSQEVALPAYTPRSLGLHPTQLYETVSMTLLFFFLLAYYPFRRHNGQVFVLFMVGYAVHRFLNEILRDDTPLEGFRMTLSQNISVLIVVAALVLELWLRRTQPKRTAPSWTEPAEPLPAAKPGESLANGQSAG